MPCNDTPEMLLSSSLTFSTIFFFFPHPSSPLVYFLYFFPLISCTWVMPDNTLTSHSQGNVNEMGKLQQNVHLLCFVYILHRTVISDYKEGNGNTLPCWPVRRGFRQCCPPGYPSVVCLLTEIRSTKPPYHNSLTHTHTK